jgi:thioesterase domain-containing protein
MTATATGPVTALVRIGNRPSCVLLPGAGGGVAPYVPLAARLGASHDVYAVRAMGLGGDERPDASVEAAADSALRALRGASISPDLVVGWSMGGAVAWELGVRLAERGNRPDLVLVDSAAVPRPAVAHDGQLHRRVERMLGQRPAPADLDHLIRTLDAQLEALRGYRTSRAFDGRVLVLRCSDRDRADWDDSMRHWHRLAAELHVASLGATHFDALTAEHVPELLARIDEFRRAAPPSGRPAGNGRSARGPRA